MICNQKGGVGKSLIADELTFSFERSNIPVAFLDLDNQGGTIHKTSQPDNALVSVIDTPGALQPQLAEWMKESSVIVIPTRTTSRDIDLLIRMQQIVKVNASNKPVVYVFNGWNRWRASSDFEEWFKQQNENKNAYVVKLPQSEKFVQTGAARMSIVKYAKRSNPVLATLNMVNTIRVLAGFSPEDSV